MVSYTITLVCFVRSTWTGTMTAGTSMRTPPWTRTGGTMAIRCSLEIVDFLLGLWSGSFYLQTSLPSPKLSADLFKSFNQIRIFICWNDLAFPCELGKKLHNIELRNCLTKHRYFMFGREIAQTKRVFENIKKCLLNFFSNSVPLDFWKIMIEGQPKPIRLF